MSRTADEVADIIQAYGAGQPTWAGVFIDHQTKRGVVGLFTDDLEIHEAAIRLRVDPTARWELAPARWTLAQLEAFRQQVDADQSWLRTIDAWWDSTGLATDQNKVLLRISSADDDAVDLVREHYGGQSWLLIETDGIGRWEGPRGTLVAIAISRRGDRVAGLDCVPIADVPSAFTSGDIGFATDAAGICRIEGVGATGYTVELKRDATGNADWVVVGRGRVTVPPNGVGQVQIVVET